MKTNGNYYNQMPMNATKSNGNGANMEQIGKRKNAKVFVYKALAIIVI